MPLWGFTVMIAHRIPLEDRVLEDLFGDQFRNWKKDTPAVVPGTSWLPFGMSTQTKGTKRVVSIANTPILAKPIDTR